MAPLVPFLCALTTLVLIVLYKRFRDRHAHRYPPSPPADPILGHARFIPRKHQAVYFHRLRENYGDVIYLNVLGRPITVLNTAKAAMDLMEKRGLNYSDRPRFVMLAEILATGANFSMRNYTKEAIRQRNLMAPLFSRSSSRKYEPTQIREVQVLMYSLLTEPKAYRRHVRRYTSAIVLEIAYGHRITRDDDEYLERAEKLSHVLSNSGGADGTPPDVLPILKYLPAWFPGAWWTRYGIEHRPTIRAVIDVPFNDVVGQIFQSRGPVSQEDAEDIKEAAGVMYGAGAETTWSSVDTFFFCMVLYPEIQEKAQREIDLIIGSGNLPTLDDRESTPFVECLLQEIMRYYPSVAMGIPHRSRDDDYYENMLIPGGSTVIANSYGINRDPAVYAEAETFKPERYLSKSQGGNDEPFPSATFGYGKRVCPGKWTAEATLWLAITYTLLTFDIKRVVGKDGKDIMPDPEFVSGLTCQPKPFLCNMMPRSEKATRLIETVVATH